ncbi:hypothetical protein K445DRAFT_314045 [Daldinia sp. EC12]|nr:hypothetical protein F4774DRAFT_404505 [Daldinia eschscholtzii]OTB19172.1 hypothetical protein K445DRAFT_314045 [Daldinia sp. EC12]
MASYTNTTSGSSSPIVVDSRSSRSSSASSYTTMSSRTSLGAGSTYYPSSSSGHSPVTYQRGRSSKSEDYRVDITQRDNVVVFEHHSSGYDKDSPSPPYGQQPKESRKSSGGKSHSSH